MHATSNIAYKREDVFSRSIVQSYRLFFLRVWFQAYTVFFVMRVWY